MKAFKKICMGIAALLAFAIAIPKGPASEKTLVVAATQATGYTSASDVSYQTTGGTIHNWGARDEVCTFLSSKAEAFYTGNYDYDVMSQKSGGSSQSNASQSDLYDSLQAMMRAKHTTQTSYNATRSLYRYTDCLMNDSEHISSFYSGIELSGTWDGGNTWNREHTWPNSKGMDGNDENDIMMLRPTSVSENSSRGNKAYGESSGFYDPNGLGQNVRGDCARIVLYVYVRWGNTSKMWGSDGVMENLSVLLDWMEEDPVDTWEMGRNDSVQSITGTRNVFVDYPEYAWLLFGKSVPTSVSTPSGGLGSGTGGGNTSSSPEDSSSSVVTPPVEDDPIDVPVAITSAPVVGKAYKFYLVQGNVSDKVLYLKGGMYNTYYFATTENAEQAIDVFVEKTNSGYYMYTGGDKQYINVEVSGTHINAVYRDDPTSVWTFDEELDTMVTTLEGEEYYLGTYNTFTTISPSSVDKAATSFVGHLCTFEEYEPPVEDSSSSDSSSSEDSSSPEDSSSSVVTPPVEDDPIDAPVAITSAPVVGKAYKLYLYQEQEDAYYYLAGGMNGYYLATTKEVSLAVDVCVEKTSGGYYVYHKEGNEKNYLNAVVSGTHINGVYESSPSSVWVFDEDLDTMLTTLNGSEYYLGTYGRYNTMGPSSIDKAADSYVAHLCTFEEYEPPVEDSSSSDSSSSEDSTIPDDSSSEDSSIPDDSSSEDSSIPDDSSSEDSSIPDDSSSEDSTIPDDSSSEDSSIPDDSSSEDSSIPDDSSSEDSSIPDDSSPSEEDSSEVENSSLEDSEEEEEDCPVGGKHTYSKWIVTQEATDKKDGEQTRTCTKCGHSETRVIAANGGKGCSGTIASGGVSVGLLTAAAFCLGKKKKKK